MITTPHPYYITPSRIQINSFFRGMGFRGAYSPTMAQEICNAYSHIMYGGNVAEAFDGPGYGKPGYEKNLKDFLSKLDYSYEGRTPMAKALSIIATIYNQKSTVNQDKENGCEDDNEAIDLFSESDSSCGSKLAQDINADLDRYEKLMPSGSYTA